MKAFGKTEHKDMEERMERRSTSKTKAKVKRRFVVVCLAVVLVFSGFSSTLQLQSSINIVDGLGTKATAVGYVASLLFCLFVTPVLLRLAGVKRALIASEVAYLIYVIANLYPNPYLLMATGVVVGFAESLFWVPISTIFNHYGKIYARHSSKSEETCVREFSGIIFGLLQFNMVFGNLFVFAILHFMGPSDQASAYNNISTFNMTTEFANTSGTFSTTEPNFVHCGANDCQDPNVTQANIERYVPTSRTPIYVLLGSFVVIMLTGMAIHFFLLPEMPLDYERSEREEHDDVMERSALTNEVDTSGNDKIVVCSKREKSKLAETFQILGTTVKDTFLQAVKFEQLLILPMSIYYGHVTGFVFSDATRAYTSCVMGVSQVGICNIIFALLSAISCYLGGLVLGKIGFQALFVTVFVLDLTAYINALLWQPSTATTWAIYVIFALLGVTGALWQILISNMYTQLFYANREVSFTIANVGFSVGFAIQYAWSTSLCVREKIYVLIALLLIVLLFLEIVWFRHNGFKEKTTTKTKKENLKC